MASVFQGYKSQLWLSFDGGSTYTKLAKISTLSPDFSREKIDCSNHDNNGSKEYLPGLKDCDLGVEYFLIDTGDATQAAVETAYVNGTDFLVKIYPLPGSGLRQWSGPFFCSKYSNSGNVSDGYKVSATFSQRGDIAPGTQP